MKRKVAIVGCGGISQVHARVLGAMEGVELCAFVDCRLDCAENWPSNMEREGLASMGT